MRKAMASLALGCAFVVALSVAASACDYYKRTNSASASQSADQTAQGQPASTEN